MSSDKILHLTHANMDSTIADSKKVLLVDFWAPWCGPCNQIAPTLDQLATELADTATIAKVNIDEQRELAVKWNVRSIPSLLFFKNGKLVDQMVGSTDKATLTRKLQSV